MSASVYSIIQVVPDPIRGERINVGAIVVNEELHYAQARVRRRVRQLNVLDPGLDGRFLRDLERRLVEQMRGMGHQQTIADNPRAFGKQELVRLHEISANIVQYTEPGVSSRPPEELLTYLLARFVDTKRAKAREVTKRPRSALRRKITREFRQLGLEEKLHKDVRVDGEHARCTFDYVVRANGSDSKLLRAFDAVVLADDRASDELFAFIGKAQEVRKEVRTALVADLGQGVTQLERDAHALVQEYDLEHVHPDDLHAWALSIAGEISR